MKNLICDKNQLYMRHQSEDIVRRTITAIDWTDVYLVSAKADVSDVSQLKMLANHIRQQCNRIVVLASQGEFTHLVITKSNNIPFLYVDEIASQIAEKYNGILGGSHSFAEVTLNQQDIIPDLIDWVVELIIVALPYGD